jgi:predicted nucleotidyltransferase
MSVMRLSIYEITNIVACTKKIFGNDSKVYLFGSRVDERKKGGDIDLYIISDALADMFNKTIFLLECLEKFLGEQKIDIVISKDTDRDIEKKARQEGILLDISSIKLKKYINECDKHVQRINEAYDDLKNTLPITLQKYKNLTKDEVQALDQYLFRFAKLQDTMGDKIFKLVIAMYEQNDEILPFKDILNRLEKYSFIHNAKEWSYLRKVRNEISHKYDDEPAEMAEALNNIVSQKETIETIYTFLKQKIETDILSGDRS